MNLCIVGNGASALNKTCGEFINSCDLVVRLGEFITEGYESFVGSKTDIFVCRWFKCKVRPVSFFQSLKEFWIPRTYKTREHKYDNLIKEYGISNTIRYIPEILIFDYKARYPFRYVEKNVSRREQESLYCCFPDSGIVAINMAKHFYPDYNIFVSGFDNCKTGYYWDTNKILDKPAKNLLELQENYLKSLIVNKDIVDLTDGII